MCLEKQTVKTSLGDDSKATLDPDRPILRVDDKRLDENTLSMQRRRKVLAVLGKQLPAARKLSTLKQLGIEAPYGLGPFAHPMYFTETDACAPFNNYIMTTVVGASGVWGFGCQWGSTAKAKVKTQQDGWVSYAPGKLPSIGDVYVLSDGDELHHCGIVCQATLDPEGFWFGGDAGQPDRTGPSHPRKSDRRWVRSYNSPDPNFPPDKSAHLPADEAAYLVPRKLDCSDPQKPLMGNFYTGGTRHTLRGWRNIAHSKITFKNNADYDKSGGKDDFERMKAWILKAEELAKKEQANRKDEDKKAQAGEEKKPDSAAAQAAP